MAGFALLVPSQIPGAKHQRRQKPQKNDGATSTLTCLQGQHDSADSMAGDKIVYRSKFSREIEHHSIIPSSSSTTSSSNNKKKNNNTNKKTISIPRTGNLPDVHWRAIPMSHLRSHPNFQPLPPPSMINKIPTKEHVRYFRQDSWQWDYLHTGRCTTSQCSAALGFLEVSLGA